ncbi:MAG: hypothetical protein BWK78_06500 [Thiotrichaceae bacterium IS1]|nr:MAG: hypothetical protein BWK78_06500 [Thiotrichaceae bacterium IS1]
MLKLKACLAIIMMCASVFAYAQINDDLYAGIKLTSSAMQTVVIQVFPDTENSLKVDGLGSICEQEEIPLPYDKVFYAEDQHKFLNNDELNITELKGLVTQAFQKIQEVHVPPEHIYVVADSSLSSPEKLKNREELDKAIQEVTKKPITFLKVEEEVGLILNNRISKKEQGRSVLIKVSSRNMKGGYRQTDSVKSEPFTTFTIPLGTKQLAEDAIENNPQATGNRGLFIETVNKLLKESLPKLLRDEMKKAPGLDNFRKVYLTGGIVWAMFTLTVPTNQEKCRSNTFKFRANDIKMFYNRAIRNTPLLFDDPIKAIEKHLQADKNQTKEEKLEPLRGEIARLQRTYDRQEDLIAGAVLLQNLSKKLEWQNKELLFLKDEHITWLISYILREKGKTDEIEDDNSKPAE